MRTFTLSEFVRLHDNALVTLAPPCSLMGPACSSVHKRKAACPQGDLNVWKVRLSNRIFANMATGQSILHSCFSFLLWGKHLNNDVHLNPVTSNQG